METFIAILAIVLGIVAIIGSVAPFFPIPEQAPVMRTVFPEIFMFF